MAMKFTDKYPNETLRALSWKQPFASLMLYGKVETRVWDSKYTGWVLICASKKGYSSKELLEVSGQEQFNRIYDTFQGDDTNWSKLPSGVAIAVGKLYSSQLMDRNMINPPKSEQDNISNIEMNSAIEWATYVQPRSGLWMHHYMSVQKIEPFEWKGKLGWSTLSEADKSKIILL